jgi:quinol monooxygenase YgiN
MQELMSIIVTVEFPTHPDKTEELKTALKGALPDTRAYDGCIKVVGTVNLDDPAAIHLIEHWESRPQYEKYLQWRVDTGLLDAIGPLLTAPPTIKYLEQLDV